MEGYAKVAHLMSKYDEFAVLRRFKRLNIQNLLYSQAEIIHLEDSLSRLVKRDAADTEREFYTTDWWTLAHGEGQNGKEQWIMVRKLKKKLNRYNARLLKQVEICNLERPSSVDLRTLRNWLERPSMGAFPIRGLDLNAWDDEDDLVAIKPRLSPDPLSRWVNDVVFPLIHRFCGEKIKDPEAAGLGDGIYNYRESLLAGLVKVVTTVVASLLPLLSIVVLFMIESDEMKLGVIVAFSALFSLALASMTNARRIEIFAATSAFAAVNVVFLTNATSTISET
ncbi:uncharacterized protein JN550_005239 [Neoarthrinium moseri]|uniref:uncharacterized protein n=1 Tax=Neoarthrinium moseri TaxID=1658444 RepID=UPI001FDCCB19|nr:uncharacterized protein JN550_005239 [Neoarthrinium moseri]KAI1870311.1 hypothetical protein JN550_005239 [Neoarthrinium moseri]